MEIKKNKIVIKYPISKTKFKDFNQKKKFKNSNFKLKFKGAKTKFAKKKLLIRKLKKRENPFLKALSAFKNFRSDKVNIYSWQNNWQNLHLQYKSLSLHYLVNKFFLKHGLYTHKFFIRLNHNSLIIKASSYGVFRVHKAKKNAKNYTKKLTQKKELSNLGGFILNSHNISYVNLKFYQLYLPKTLVELKAPQVFKKYKRERFFWESLQLVNLVFKGYASASILGGLVYNHTKRNPKRIAFIAYLKRLLDWHFRASLNSQIQGVRIEVKGRFNAKSRAKKRIVSAGRVRIHEKSSNVEYAFLEAITKFGSLGIKVWVCPLPLKKICY